MSKIITNAIQAHGGEAISLPITPLTKGPLGLDDTNTMVPFDLAPLLPPENKVLTKTFDFRSSPTSKLKVLWSDFKDGLREYQIAFVKISGGGVSSNNACQLNVKGLDAAEAEISAGYLGANYQHTYSSGVGGNGQTNNSNKGNWWFPCYTSMAATNYSHGSGITFDLTWHFKREGTNGNYSVAGKCGYQQNTTYNQANIEVFAWDSYSTNSPPVTAITGFELYPSAGQLNRGSILVEVVLR